MKMEDMYFAELWEVCVKKINCNWRTCYDLAQSYI